jgi:hypothetical protein
MYLWAHGPCFSSSGGTKPNSFKAEPPGRRRQETTFCSERASSSASACSHSSALIPCMQSSLIHESKKNVLCHPFPVFVCCGMIGNTHGRRLMISLPGSSGNRFSRSSSPPLGIIILVTTLHRYRRNSDRSYISFGIRE